VIFGEVQALTGRELRRWFRAWYAVVITFITPFVWLTVFGKSFNFAGVFSVPGIVPPAFAEQFQELSRRIVTTIFGTYDYFTYLAAGMLAVFLLFTTMFNGMSLVWDRRIGFLAKLVAAPIRRESIFLSRVLSGVIRGLLQVTVIFAIALLFGLNLGTGFTPLHAAGVFVALALLAIGFASIFTAMATGITTHETLFAVANLVNLPLMFTSNALFPTSQMPDWLQAIARVNPITYAASTVRGLILVSLDSSALVLNYAILGGFALASLVLGAYLSKWALTRKPV
jgi:ABC-2 type transport system permease protein